MSGATYSIGTCVYSPINFQTYRRKTNGAGATDPSADATNWQQISAGGEIWITKTANYTAAPGDNIFADTSGGGFIVTLPASPLVGDKIKIEDVSGSFATNNLIVARNGNKIMNVAEDMTIRDNNWYGTLSWSGSTYGWRKTA